MRKLVERMNDYDVISFDIFDTLIMRKTLYPHDIFEIVEKKAEKRGIEVENFCESRMKAEQNLIADIPDIYELYRELQKITEISDKNRESLMHLELETEHENIIRREEMCEILSQAHADGKKIYLVSDMYIPQRILTVWLRELGIVDYDGIFVSCEYHKPKVNGLYNVFKTAVNGDKFLHIGDNPVYDGIYAEKSGIRSYVIKSSLELLELTKIIPYKQFLNELQNRLIIGLVISKLFNNPFCMDESNYLTVDSLGELVFCAAAPMIACFVQWLTTIASQKKYANILLPARDGFLIERMLKHMEKLNGRLCYRYIYLYASRVSYSVIEMQNYEQFVQTIRRPGNVSLAECIEERYGLKFEEERQAEFFEKHKRSLLDTAFQLKKQYLRYFEKLHIEGHTAFLDFVSSGTCLSLLQDIWGHKADGLFCYRYSSKRNDKKQMEINSFLDDLHGEKFWKYYKIFEVIMTSFDGTFLRINKDGLPVFEEEHRSKEELEAAGMLQETVMCFWDAFLKFEIASPVSVDLLIELSELFTKTKIKKEDIGKDPLYLYDSYEGGKIKVFD